MNFDHIARNQDEARRGLIANMTITYVKEHKLPSNTFKHQEED